MKHRLEYATPARPAEPLAQGMMTNQQARMICGAVLMGCGVIAVDVQSNRGGDLTGGIIGLFGFVIFLIEFIKSFPRR